MDAGHNTTMFTVLTLVTWNKLLLINGGIAVHI